MVPLLNGSGTRLKVLEAMGFGVPVVSTKKGAEGIEYTEGKDILIGDTAREFADTVLQLLNDKEKIQHIADTISHDEEVVFNMTLLNSI